MNNTRMVTYERKILVANAKNRYENQRVGLEITDAIRDGESVEEAYRRIKNFVDGEVLMQLVRINGGEVAQREVVRRNRKLEYFKAANKQFGFDFTDEYIERTFGE